MTEQISKSENSLNPQCKKQSAFSPLSDNNQPFDRPPTFDSSSNKHSNPIFCEVVDPEPELNLDLNEHEEEGYYCMTCNQNYNISISNCHHKKGEQLKFKCDYEDCRRSFSIESGLQRHRLTHTGAKPYECDYEQCQQRFNQKSNLNRHKRIHTQEKPFICQKCCKSFTTTTNLKQHVQVHFEDKERRKKYLCEIKGCNKEYLYMCNLKKHKQQHEDPMAGCLGQKKPDCPVFSLNIGLCLLKIAYKNSKQHSEVLITHKSIDNSVHYDLGAFQGILNEIHKEARPMQERQGKSFMEQIQSKMESIIQSSKNSLNICFEMHDDLSPVTNLLVKSVVNLLGHNNFKVFTIVIPNYHVFRDVVQNLLVELQPDGDN